MKRLPPSLRTSWPLSTRFVGPVSAHKGHAPRYLYRAHVASSGNDLRAPKLRMPRHLEITKGIRLAQYRYSFDVFKRSGGGRYKLEGPSPIESPEKLGKH